jgi:acetyl esterase/lipase
MNTPHHMKSILIASLVLLIATFTTFLLHAQEIPATQPAPATQPEPKAKPKDLIQRNIPFAKAGNTPLLLDIAVPPAGDGPFPAILFLHGGGWAAGRHSDLAPFLQGAAQIGYVGISSQYRLVPKAHFPAQIYDCKAAVRWIRANARQYKIDPNRIYVVGFSAGGHLASPLGLTTPADGLEGTPPEPGKPADPNTLTDANFDQSTQVHAVVNFFGPTDFTTRDWPQNLETAILNPFLGGSFNEIPDIYKKASPITYATKSAPPFLFIHGTDDPVVPVDQSKRLAQKLKELGANPQLVILENEKHGFSPANNQKTILQMVEFLAAQQKK